MKTRIKIGVLLGLAIVLGILLGAASDSLALVSPLMSPLPVMPKMPTGLEHCPIGCVEVYDEIGRPTCNTWCVQNGGYDVALEDQTQYALEQVRKVVATQVVEVKVTRKVVEVVGAERRTGELWMNRYPIWRDESGRVTRVEGYD